jgi:hypothetical protein
MTKRILLPVIALFALVAGASHGFRPPAGGGHPPAAPPRPPVHHTPTFTPPRPVYRPPAVTHPSPPPVVHHNPAFVPKPPRPVNRPPATTHAPPIVIRPHVPPQRPIVGVGGQPWSGHWPSWTSRGIYVQRTDGIYRPGYAYYHHWHDGWHHGYWAGWYQRPWLWFGNGVSAGWLLSTGQRVIYWNPYYVVPPVVVFDYSHPIAVPAPAAIDQPPAAAGVDDGVTAATRLLDAARQAFRAKDYARSRDLIDRAVPLSPNDTTLHEFRALALFAQRQYRDASATIYGVLAVGPGWDWETLRALYSNPDTYTSQLRALEAYVAANPTDAASRFLLAYHYLTLDARDAAARMLKGVIKLQPKDELAAHLLQMLEKKEPTDRPAPGG